MPALTPKLGIDGLFALNNTSRFHGTSGPTIINKRSGFGYIAKGVNQRQGEALIALRGTQFTHLYDVWTDANIGVQKGPSGWPVHAGFNDTFNSIKAELLNFFVKNNPCHVHCIGHSLGGALATLVADYLSELGVGEISLYTFGCPRVGNAEFSKNLTGKIGVGCPAQQDFFAKIVALNLTSVTVDVSQALVDEQVESRTHHYRINFANAPSKMKNTRVVLIHQTRSRDRLIRLLHDLVWANWLESRPPNASRKALPARCTRNFSGCETPTAYAAREQEDEDPVPLRHYIKFFQIEFIQV